MGHNITSELCQAGVKPIEDEAPHEGLVMTKVLDLRSISGSMYVFLYLAGVMRRLFQMMFIATVIVIFKISQ